MEDADYPIVAEVDASTIDEDTGAPVGAPYVLSAPAGKSEFVSPLTTMVHSVLEDNPTLSAEDAEAVVKSDLGYTADSSVDLFHDYVEAKNDSENADSAEYERLHRIAQVVAEVMEDNFEQIEQAATDAGLDPVEAMDSLVAILTEQVLEQLDVIAAAADDETASVEDIATNTVGSVDTTTIAEDVEAEELTSAIEAAPIQSAVAAGVNWIEGDEGGIGDPPFDRGRITLNDAGDALVEVFYEYDPTAAGFVEYQPDEIEFIIGPNGLAQTNDTLTGAAFTLNSDGSATVSFAEGAYQERVSMSSLDVAGQPIVAFLNGEDHELVAAAIDPQTAVFGPGSVVYRWTSVIENAHYELWGDCLMLGGACATSLGQLTSTAIFIGYDEAAQSRIDAELLADGSAEFYVTSSTGVATLLATGSWSIETVGGEEVMIAQIPASVMERPELYWYDSDKLVAAVVNGVVMQGEEIPAGEIDVEEEWTFNDAAMQSIIDNFNP